jgi:nucleotide-binding universal stress UspA family protein
VKRILVATDGSEGSDRAVDFAADLAKTHGADLLIVNIRGGYGLSIELMRQFSDTDSAWFEELLKTTSAEILNSARDRAHSAGVPNIVLESRGGHIAEAIIDFAEEKDADAIVVGKRGSGDMTEMLLGSVPQKLVNLASRVIMVVP